VSGVLDFIICKQCSYRFADCEYGTKDGSFWSLCSRCGHYLRNRPLYDEGTKEYVRDSGGHVVWENIDEKGVGALCYQAKTSRAFIVSGVEPDRFDETKKLLEEALKQGKILPEPLYLSRWNDDTQRVELILGQFPPDLNATIEAKVHNAESDDFNVKPEATQVPFETEGEMKMKSEELTDIQRDAFDKVFALRQLEAANNINTREAQNAVLLDLSEEDLAIVAVALEDETPTYR
jgi:hypothetical protein